MNGSLWSVKYWNGAALAVLLALEEERRIEAEEHDSRSHAPLGRRKPVAGCAVADLVVILGAGHDPRALRPRELGRDAGHGAVEVRVIPVLLPGQGNVQRVVEAVEPHRVVAPLLERPEVGQAHLADHERAGMDGMDAVGELREHVAVGVVLDGMNRIEPEAVDPVVADPELGVLDRPLAHAEL